MKNRSIRARSVVPVLSSLAVFCTPLLAQTSKHEIVVTASRTEQILTDVLPHTTVLGRDAIEQSQVMDLPSLLSREAGFQFTQTGGRGGQATAFLRGAASLQVLVLVDGIPMTKQDTTGAVSLEHIMLDQVDRIEIVRGNVSAIHGSGAVGGVIQVFTRQGSGQPTLFATVEQGSLGTSRRQVGTQGSVGRMGYSVSVSRLDTRGINAANVAQSVNVNPDVDGYTNENRTLALSYKFSADHLLGVRSTQFDGRFDYDVPGSFSSPQDVHKGGTKIESNSFFWSGRLNSVWSTRLSYTDSKERNTTRTLGLFPFATEAETRSQITSWSNKFDLDAWVLSWGADHQSQGIEMSTDGVSGLSRQRSVSALYGGTVFNRNAHGLQLNVRRDEVQGLSHKDSLYLGYGFNLNRQWKLIASHSTAFNVPPLGYLFDPYSGNPNLRPETAETQEFGLQWTAGPHRLRSTWFDTRTRDLLLYDFNTWQFGNVSRVKNQGLETSYSGRFHMTDLRASLSLQDPINETTGLQLVRRAKTLASVSVSQSLGLWTLGGSVRYTGARPDVAGVPELPSNVLVDLTARYVLSRDWTAFGRIENFTDARYQTAFGYNQLPRTFTIGLSWKMKHVKP
jgi:vitamin B12 transporter